MHMYIYCILNIIFLLLCVDTTEVTTDETTTLKETTASDVTTSGSTTELMTSDAGEYKIY